MINDYIEHSCGVTAAVVRTSREEPEEWLGGDEFTDEGDKGGGGDEVFEFPLEGSIFLDSTLRSLRCSAVRLPSTPTETVVDFLNVRLCAEFLSDWRGTETVEKH